jgi:hypothetical protein
MGQLELIWGVKAIAAELNISERRAFYLLENRRLPAKKEGHLWVSSRPALRRHFADLTDGGAG